MSDERPNYVVETVVRFVYTIDPEYAHNLTDGDVVGHAIDAYLDPYPDDVFTVESYGYRPERMEEA